MTQQSDSGRMYFQDDDAGNAAAVWAERQNKQAASQKMMEQTVEVCMYACEYTQLRESFKTTKREMQPVAVWAERQNKQTASQKIDDGA